MAKHSDSTTAQFTTGRSADPQRLAELKQRAAEIAAEAEPVDRDYYAAMEAARKGDTEAEQRAEELRPEFLRLNREYGHVCERIAEHIEGGVIE